jgi:glucuronate isomerase
MSLRERLYAELDALIIVDPHTHINPLAPASTTLADVLGYHYYTELAHSAGLAREAIEEPELPPREKVRRLVEHLEPLQNTIQYSWLIEMLREFFGFYGERLTLDNWETVYEHSLEVMARPHWANTVLEKSKLRAVFLTNEFDDPLNGFDTSVYVPCLRTDDLVFHLAKPEVRARLERVTGISATSAATLRQAVGKLFEHFRRHNVRACAISLPPTFAPRKVNDAAADKAMPRTSSSGRSPSIAKSLRSRST